MNDVNPYKLEKIAKRKYSERKKRYKNKYGYYRVSKRVREGTKQGFSYVYSYGVNGKPKHIESVSLEKLEKKVKNKGLLWEKY